MKWSLTRNPWHAYVILHLPDLVFPKTHDKYCLGQIRPVKAFGMKKLCLIWKPWHT